MSAILLLAKSFSTIAHDGQFRKEPDNEGNPIPYIRHPEAVVNTLEEWDEKYNLNLSEEIYSVAWLHDVVEDTSITQKEIERAFGSRIANGVGILSKVKYPKRDMTVFMYNQQLKDMPISLKILKLADIDCNLKDIAKSDNLPWVCRFLTEKRAMLGMLKLPKNMQIISRRVKYRLKKIENQTYRKIKESEYGQLQN